MFIIKVRGLIRKLLLVITIIALMTRMEWWIWGTTLAYFIFVVGGLYPFVRQFQPNWHSAFVNSVVQCFGGHTRESVRPLVDGMRGAIKADNALAQTAKTRLSVEDWVRVEWLLFRARREEAKAFVQGRLEAALEKRRQQMRDEYEAQRRADQAEREARAVQARANALRSRALVAGITGSDFEELVRVNGLDSTESLIGRRERLNKLCERATELGCLPLMDEHVANVDDKGAATVIARVEQVLRDSGEFRLTRKVPELIARGDLTGAEAAVRDARTKAVLEQRFQPYTNRIQALDPGKTQDELWRQMKTLKKLTPGSREFRKAEHAFEQALANAERYGTTTEPPN